MITGHWKNLEEVQKLTQSTLLAGIIQEIYEEGELLPFFPVTGLKGTKLEWNRQKVRASGADYYGIGDQIPWEGGNQEYDRIEFALKTVIKQKPLDKFIARNYPTLNDYKAVQMSELREGCMYTIEDGIIYNDPSVAGQEKQFHGLYSLMSAAQCVDGGETALSLLALKRWIRLIKPRPDLLICAPVIADRFDEVYEYGIVQEAAAVGIGVRGQTFVTRKPNQLGMTVTHFDGIPIHRSTYMVAEQANTGIIGSGARAKHSSGTAMYSIIGVRFGQIDQGGVCMLLGDGTGGPEFFEVIEFEHLEDYNAGGTRMVAYCEIANGSTRSLGAYMDITDAAFTV